MDSFPEKQGELQGEQVVIKDKEAEQNGLVSQESNQIPQIEKEVLQGEIKKAGLGITVKILGLFIAAYIVAVASRNLFKNLAGSLMGETVFMEVLSILVAIVITSVIAYFTVRHFILKPLEKLKTFAQKLRDNDFSGQMDLLFQDEFGQLSHVLGHLAANFRLLVGEIKDAAKALMDQSMELAEQFEQLEQGGQQVAITTQDLAEGVNNQSIQIADTAKAVEEVSRDINVVAEKAANLEKSMREVVTSATYGAEAANQALIKVEEVRGAANNTKHAISDLEKDSTAIEGILDVINNIAEQTNLLALNAAIEAARAGDAGRGFAVVAEEVRKLAEQSQNATQEIAVLIKKTQSNIANASNYVLEVDAGIGESAATSAEAKVTFEKMAENLQQKMLESQEMNALSENIRQAGGQAATAVGEMFAIIEETAAGIEEVGSSAQEQAASVEHVRGLAQQLADLGKNFNELTKRFKI